MMTKAIGNTTTNDTGLLKSLGPVAGVVVFVTSVVSVEPVASVLVEPVSVEPVSVAVSVAVAVAVSVAVAVAVSVVVCASV